MPAGVATPAQGVERSDVTWLPTWTRTVTPGLVRHQEVGNGSDVRDHHPQGNNTTMASTDEEAPHITAIRRSMQAGFRFLHIPDAGGHAIAVIHAERSRGSRIETYTVRAMDEAVAARIRTEDYPDGAPVWQQHGTVEEVVTAVLELPPPGASRELNRTRRRSSSLWLPG